MSYRCVLNYTIDYTKTTIRPYIKRRFYAEHLKPNEPYEEKETGTVNGNPYLFKGSKIFPEFLRVKSKMKSIQTNESQTISNETVTIVTRKDKCSGYVLFLGS